MFAKKFNILKKSATLSRKTGANEVDGVVSSSPALAALAAPLEPRDYDYSVNILVMGLAEAGKTTLQRQLDVMYGTKLLDPKYYQRLIYGNTIATLIRLIENAERVNIAFSDDNTERVKRVLATPIELARNRLPRFPLRLGYDCKCLWEDPDMQTMFHYANCCPEYRTPGRTKYYMENMFRVFSPEFTPNRLDIISAYEQVDHPQHSTLTYRRLKIELTCSPTKPIQKRDWNAIEYHDPHYIFYVVSLKDYHAADEMIDSSLITSPTCDTHFHNNILLDSLAALESFSNSDVFEKAHSIFLIFNTSESFVQKLKHFDLKLCFEDYNDGSDHLKAIDYITNKFTQILIEKNKPHQAYSIDLLDQEETRVKFDSMLDYIIPDAESRGLYESIPVSSLHPTSILPHSSSIGVKPLNDNHIEISSATTSTTSTRNNGSAIGSASNSITSALAAASLDDDTVSNASTSTASSVTNPAEPASIQTSAEHLIPLTAGTPPKKPVKSKVDKREQKAEKQREKELLRAEKEQQRAEKEQQRAEKEQQRAEKEQQRAEKELQRAEKEKEKEREREAANELKRAEKEKQDKEKERLRSEKEQQLKEKEQQMKEKKAAAACAAATAPPVAKPKKKGKGLTSVQSGFTSIQGRRKNMEDAHQVIDNLCEIFKQAPAHEGVCAYYGVYDGHGGTQTALALEPVVHKCIVESGSFSQGNYEQAMKEGFDAADKMVIPVCEKSGSTGVAAMIIGNTLYTANIGDSECVIARLSPTSSSKSPVYDTQLLTYKHLANDEKEKARITEMGGMIIFGRLFGSLAVARSFGDREYKEGDKKFVTSEPYTQVIELTPKDHYIIMGCDGLWDKVSYEDATAMCTKLHKQGKNAKEISEALVNDSFDNGSTDNITVVVIILNWK